MEWGIGSYDHQRTCYAESPEHSPICGVMAAVKTSLLQCNPTQRPSVFLQPRVPATEASEQKSSM
jgi:hypothetical protein